jgi:hypothetical protein
MLWCTQRLYDLNCLSNNRLIHSSTAAWHMLYVAAAHSNLLDLNHTLVCGIALAGLLNCLPNILQPCSHPDQQYPSSTRPWFSSSLEMLFGVIRSLCGMWYTSIPHAPALVPPVLRVALPLLQQLQRCIPPTPAPCHGPSTSASSSASGPAAAAASVNSKVLCALHRAKIGWAFLLWSLGNAARQPQGLPADCAGLLDQLLHEPDAATLLLQLLVAGAAQQHHTYEQQQRGHPVGNSSRTFKQQQQKQQKQRNALDLSHIPAFHLDMLHLLPGGAAYLDAAAAADHSSAQERIEENRHTTRVYLMMLEIMINRSSNGYPGSAPLQSDAPVLSAAAVRLALELQLLAAADVLEQQQQRRADPAGEQRAIERLAQTNMFLAYQITAARRAARSCLPPEVLQQAGVQLLQALAAPLKLLQMSSPGNAFFAAAWRRDRAVPGWYFEQTYTLSMAAAAAKQVEGECGCTA